MRSGWRPVSQNELSNSKKRSLGLPWTAQEQHGGAVWTYRAAGEPRSQAKMHAVRIQQMRCCLIVSRRAVSVGVDAQRVAVLKQGSRQSG